MDLISSWTRKDKVNIYKWIEFWGRRWTAEKKKEQLGRQAIWAFIHFSLPKKKKKKKKIRPTPLNKEEKEKNNSHYIIKEATLHPISVLGTVFL